MVYIWVIGQAFFYDGWNDWPSTFCARSGTKMESRSVNMDRKDEASIETSSVQKKKKIIIKIFNFCVCVGHRAES